MLSCLYSLQSLYVFHTGCFIGASLPSSVSLVAKGTAIVVFRAMPEPLVSDVPVAFSLTVGLPKTRVPPALAVSVIRVLMVTFVPMIVWMPVVTLIAVTGRMSVVTFIPVITMWPVVPSTITIAKMITRTTYAE